MSLRLVRPPEEGQVTRPPKGRRSASLVLAVEEHRNLRQALRNLRLRFGSWSCLAAVMGVPPGTLATAASRRGRGSVAVALCAARAAHSGRGDVVVVSGEV
jgi:hypothetical protein